MLIKIDAMREARLRMSMPKILLTTSRNPTNRTRTLCNDLTRILPSGLRVNRGKMSNEQLAEKAFEEGAERILLVERGQGESGVIRFCNVGPSGLFFIPPGIHISDIRLRRDFKTPSRVKTVTGVTITGPATSEIVTRFAEMLAEFLGISLLSVDEVARRAENLVVLGQDRTGRLILTFIAEPYHLEVGPRVTVSKMEWTLEA